MSVSTIFSGFSNLIESGGKRDEYRIGRQISAMQAQEAELRGRWNVRRQRLLTNRTLATQRSLFGYAGIELSGSSADVMQETAKEMELDKQNMWREAMMAKTLHLAEYERYEQALDRLKTADWLNRMSIGFGIVSAFAGGGK